MAPKSMRGLVSGYHDMHRLPSGKIKTGGNMKPSISGLKQAFDFMIQVVSERSDGEGYVPIVLHLKQQTAAHESTETEY